MLIKLKMKTGIAVLSL